MKIPGIIRLMLPAMLIALFMFVVKSTAHADDSRFVCRFCQAGGIGAETGIMRRDPPDTIKVGDLYYGTLDEETREHIAPFSYSERHFKEE